MTITNDAVRHQRRRVTGGDPPLPRPRSGTATGRAGQHPLELHQHVHALTGEPLRDLAEIRASGGVLEHTFHLTEQQEYVGDVTVDTGGCHANMPDDVLRVHPGDRMKVRPEGANGNRTYTCEIPATQPAGAHWYRPQAHAESTYHPLHGLVCPMVVEGEIDQVPDIVHARERIMVINGLRPDDTTFTLNGQLQPEVGIQPGEVQRWRVFNAEPHHAIWIHLEGHTLHQIGHDGIPFHRTRPVQTILLAPGSRAELLVRANKPGEYRFLAQSCDQGRQGQPDQPGKPGQSGRPRPVTDLATMLVNGRSVFSRLPRDLVDMPTAPGPVAKSQTVHVSGAPDRGITEARLYVDGRELTPDRISQQVTAGALEEWTLVNDDAIPAVIYLNGHPFQVVEVEGGPAGDPSWLSDADIWHDTFRLPSHGQATVRVYGREAPTRR